MLTSRLFLIVLLFSAASAQAQTAEIPDTQEIIEFESKLGNVSFAHKAHAGLKNVECKTCHHTYPEEGGLQDCHNCHKPQAGDAPKAKDAFHLRCRGCHKYTVEEGGEAGPVKKCKLCHQKKAKPQ
jgi:hypothetical protein